MRGTVGALAAVALLAGCSGAATGENGPSSPPDRGTDAWVICEKFVERHVEISDIDFGGRDATTIKGDGEGPYVVTSTFATGGEPVDYTCKVRHNTDTEQWTLVDLKTGW